MYPSQGTSLEAIGTLDWLRRSRGRLSLKEKLRLMNKALAPTVAELLIGRWTAPRSEAPASLAALQAVLPDTPAVARCIELMEETGHSDLLQHGWRTYWWGAAFARMEARSYDEELLLISSLMHDFGVADPQGAAHRACACFTEHSALTAVDVVHGCGWDTDRARKLGDVIALHMNGVVPVEQGVEAHLLQRGAACDVIGAQLSRLHKAYRGQVLHEHPRGLFDQTFGDYLKQQSKLHPDSRAALMVKLGVPLMIKLHPF